MSTTNIANDPGSVPGQQGEPTGAPAQAKEAAGTAVDEGKRVAGVAQGEVKNLASEAQTQLRGLVEEATSQVDEQSSTQLTRLAGTVRTFGDDLHSMGSPENADGLAAQLVQQVADQARGLASHLDAREPRELLEDARGFARNRPGTFLVGALAAGLVVGRLTRGAKASHDSTSGTTGTDVDRAPAPVAHVEPTLGHQAAPTYTTPDLDAPVVDPRAVEISEAGVPDVRGGRA